MKLLGFDNLIARLRALAGALPDPRTGDNTRFSMADIALAAFSVFFTGRSLTTWRRLPSLL